MLRERETKPEIMDDFSIRDERIDAALNELNVINKYLGGRSVTRSGIRELLKNSEYIKVLDAGAGGADVFDRLAESGRVKLYPMDINPRACRYLKEKQNSQNVFCADIMRIPVKRDSLDAVHFSLFLHHFTEKEIIDILTNTIKLVSKGIVINDLRRSAAALAGIKLLTMIFSKSKMVKEDAVTSVRKGFKKKELVSILEILNCRYKISRKWAYRWLVVIYK